MRLLNKEYQLLDSAEQSAIRHFLYQKQGKFAKLLIPLLEQFKQLEMTLVATSNDSTESQLAAIPSNEELAR